MMTSRNGKFLKGGFSGLMIAAAVLCGASAAQAAGRVDILCGDGATQWRGLPDNLPAAELAPLPWPSVSARPQ